MRRVLTSALAIGLAACGGGSPGGPSQGPSPLPSASPAAVCTAGPPVAGTPPLTTVKVAFELADPVDLTAPPGDTRRLFVAERAGRIRIIRDGAVLDAPFLDLRERVSTRQEQGLLGLTFHPRYPENGRFFIHYTDREGRGHITEFRVSPDPERADPATERDLILDDVSRARHHAGGLAFGPDGMLYLGFGDGSSGGDPQRNAQNLGLIYGKILRIDVDRGDLYAVPPDNPFVGTPGARAEVWAYGLRNPWRFSFDPVTRDLLIGDVGQAGLEEINLGLGSRPGGENYGWNITEGNNCYSPPTGCQTAGITFAILEYDHRQGGCAVIAGPVYRGCRMPGLHGTFFYGDFCSGQIRSLRVQDARAVDHRDWTSSLGEGLDRVTSFGVDRDGEIYIVDSDGEIYKIVPAI